MTWTAIELWPFMMFNFRPCWPQNEWDHHNRASLNRIMVLNISGLFWGATVEQITFKRLHSLVYWQWLTCICGAFWWAKTVCPHSIVTDRVFKRRWQQIQMSLNPALRGVLSCVQAFQRRVSPDTQALSIPSILFMACQAQSFHPLNGLALLSSSHSVHMALNVENECWQIQNACQLKWSYTYLFIRNTVTYLE